MNVKKVVSAVLIALSIELAVYAVAMHFLYTPALPKMRRRRESAPRKEKREVSECWRNAAV